MNRLLKILAGLVIAVVTLTFMAFNLTCWLMRSDRLTLLTEHQLSKSINGRVEIGNVDLKLWSTFPHARIEASDLLIVSHSLHDAPDYLIDEIQPSDDTLARVNRITADLNIKKLITRAVDIDSVIIDGPWMNLVVADYDLANFDIIPEHISRHAGGSSIKNLREFKIGKIEIINTRPSTYISLLDGSDISFHIPDFSIDGTDAPDYTLSFTSEITSETLDEVNFSPLVLGANGGIHWDYLEPDVLKLSKLHLNIGDFKFILSTRIDLKSSLSLNALDLTIDRLKINTIIDHMPPVLADDYRDLDTDLRFTLNLNVTDTIHVDNLMRVPTARMSLDIPDCEFHYGETHLSSASLRAHALINGAELNSSVINVDTLILAGEGFRADVTGRATDIIDDPRITAWVKSDITLGALPPYLRRALPMTLGGHLTTDAGIDMTLSEMSFDDFHRIILDGNIDIDNFRMKMKNHPIAMKARNASFDLGSTSSYSDASYIAVDSLLSLTMAIDNAVITLPGNTLEASSLLADLGNPAGMSPDPLARKLNAMIRLGSFTYDTSDSVRVRLRDTETLATLSRYPADPEHPQIDFTLTARRFTTRAGGFGVAVSQPVIDVTSHLLPDSVIIAAGRLPRRSHVNNLDSIIDRDVIDWNLTTWLQKMLLGWDIDGSLRSNAGFVFVHDFPLRQRAYDIDLDFNTDSVTFRSLRYTIGHSEFDITGSVSNMSRSFTATGRNIPLVADLNIHSPLIDVNELLVTSFHETSGTAGPDPDYTEEIFDHHVTTDTTASRPLIIPRNITADLNLQADSVLYSDLRMNDLTGSILLANSALNLHNLNASSPVGNANLSALYWAPDTSDMTLGMGLELNSFDLGRTLRLIPALGRMLPALRGFTGTVDAQMAATTDLDPDMNIDMSSFKGTVKLEGDSLALVDPEHFKSLSRWLMFHDRHHIDIDHIDLEMVIDNRRIDLFPFIFDIDRYRLGVMGSNNLDMDLNYHVSVLKSPIPFKFGINITGPAHEPKIRLGGAKIKDSTIRHFNIADSTFTHLLDEINTVFNLGTMSRNALRIPPAPIVDIDQYTDSLSADEQHWMQQQGWIKPDTVAPEPKKHHKHHFWIF